HDRGKIITPEAPRGDAREAHVDDETASGPEEFDLARRVPVAWRRREEPSRAIHGALGRQRRSGGQREALPGETQHITNVRAIKRQSAGSHRKTPRFLSAVRNSRGSGVICEHALESAARARAGLRG